MHALEEKNALTQELEKTRKIMEDLQCEKVKRLSNLFVLYLIFILSPSINPDTFLTTFPDDTVFLSFTQAQK